MKWVRVSLALVRCVPTYLLARLLFTLYEYTYFILVGVPSDAA